MQKQEFEERIERTVTDEQYKVIEEVYMWHPSIRNTSGKDEVVDCEPQDVIRYVLACAGIEDYVLSDEHYGKKDLFVIDRKSGINTIAEVNSSWGIKNPFFFQKKVFYWGTKEEQKEIYVLEEGETILSLNTETFGRRRQ